MQTTSPKRRLQSSRQVETEPFAGLGSASRTMLRRIPRPLALLLAVAALLSVAWTFTLAPFQGPDEPAHFNYSQYLAETGHRPSVNLGGHPDSTAAANALYFFNLDQLA